MKALFAVLAFVVSAQAQARGVSQELSTVSFDGSTLEVSYRTGGGCNTHIPTAVVTIENDDKALNTVSAKVEIVDTTKDGQPDFCEAMISVSGKIDLATILKKSLKDAGIDLNRTGGSLVVELPKVEVNLR